MSAPVDVLAFLDAPIDHARRFGAHRGFTGPVKLDELIEARAAVAALIEAAVPFTQGTYWLTNAQHDALRAALDRLGAA